MKSITVTPEQAEGLRLSPKALVSIKYDGIQGRWDGKGNLTTKTGAKINAPEWFLDRLPEYPVVGELWAGNGRFQLCQSVVMHTSPHNVLWCGITFKVFEVPEGRMLDHYSFPVAEEVERFPVAGKNIRDMAEGVIADGGEGLVILDRGLFIKVKASHDAEATVMGYEMTKSGKKKVASLIVNSEGKKFKISAGLSNLDRLNPPAIGERITYTFSGITDSGLPRHAAYLRKRSVHV